MEYAISGFLLSLSLIVAIGAQNAFVLRQGLASNHVFWVCSVCAVSDAVLIFAGMAGFGAAVKAFPELELIARYGGAIFLVAYGVKSVFSAIGGSHVLEPGGQLKGSSRADYRRQY